MGKKEGRIELKGALRELVTYSGAKSCGEYCYKVMRIRGESS